MSVEEFRFNTFADSRPVNIQKNICSVKNAHLTYSPSYNLTPPICGVWLVNTWFFAHWHHQPAVTRLENVRHLNIRRGKKLGFQLPHRQTSKISKMKMFSRIYGKKLTYDKFRFSSFKYVISNIFGKLIHDFNIIDYNWCDYIGNIEFNDIGPAGQTQHKKWSFPVRISSVNATKSLMENFIFCAGCKK